MHFDSHINYMYNPAFSIFGTSQNQIQEKHRKTENSQTQRSDTQTSNNIPQWAEHILDCP